MAIVQWFEARAWQVGTIAAAACAVFLAITAGVLWVQKTNLQRDNAALTLAAERSQRDLTTCHQSVDALTKAVADQSAEVQRVAQAGADRLKAAEKAIAAGLTEAQRLQSRVDLLLRTPALGADRCARVDEVDRAVQEAFR